MNWLAFSLMVSIFNPPTPVVQQHKPYTFAVIGDTQVNKHIFLRAIKDIKKRKPKFVIHVGDLYWCSSKYWWRWYRKHIRSTKIPWHMVVGNHELLGCGLINPQSKWKWKRFWRRKKYRRSTLKIFEYNTHKYILMDSASYRAPRGHTKVIRRALRTTRDKSVFLFSHMPLPYPRGKLKLRYGPQKKLWHYYWVMAGLGWHGHNKILWRMLHKYKNKIRSFFHGHYHAFRRYNLSGIDAYNTGGGGGKLETKRDFHHYLMVGVRNNKHYVKVVRL